MRRSASEIIRNLETRIAKLEGRKESSFYGNSTKIDHSKCVIMLETNDSSPLFQYCFMHLDSALLRVMLLNLSWLT